MNALNIKELSEVELGEELSKFNTHIVDGELCLAGKILPDIGIMTDFNHVKYLIPIHKKDKVKKIEKEAGKDSNFYRIYFNDGGMNEIIAFNRPKVNGIPISNKSIDLLDLLDIDIFDDTLSFLLTDNDKKAVVGLDLFKLILNSNQKHILIRELEDLEQPPIIRETGITNTLCLVVDLKYYTFSFQRLNVNTAKVSRLKASEKLHNKHYKVTNYVQNMLNAYTKAQNNLPEKISIIKELGELVSTRKNQ